MGGEMKKSVGQAFGFGLIGHLGTRRSQSDDVGVGVVHGDGYGVLLIFVPGIVVRASFQEETHQPEFKHKRATHLTWISNPFAALK